MPGQLYKAAAIVGAAEADEIGFLEEPKTALQLHIEAIKNVCAQTGIPMQRIEGVFSTGWTPELCEHLGITPKYIDTTAVGGSSFELHVHHALAAINSGIIDVALITHGENGHSSRKIGGRGPSNYGMGGGGVASPGTEMTMAYGLGGAPASYAHTMVRHMHRFGTTREDYAHIAKVSRDWATLNPRAAMYSKEKHPFGGPITVQQVEESRSDCLAVDHSALLHGGRSWRRRYCRLAEGGCEPEHPSCVDRGCWRKHGALEHARDERFHGDFRGHFRRNGLHHGGDGAGRHGNGSGVRLLHHHCGDYR